MLTLELLFVLYSVSIRVPTYVAESPIHGLGLFAAVDIPEGAVVWDFDSNIDVVLEKPTKEQEDYCWREYDKYIMPGDEAKYINHSDNPNTAVVYYGGPTIATRNIMTGEEITENYQYDDDWMNYAETLK